LTFLVASVWTGRRVAALHASSAVTIAVTGHQWWWEIQYEDAVPARRVTTANELHIPTNRPIVLKVTSRDVIHSFWVPSLYGKRDLIPGYTTAIWLQADRPGVFRGQCAEFCCLQHAHMALTVTAEPSATFEDWLEAQRPMSPQPNSEAARRRDDDAAGLTARRRGPGHARADVGGPARRIRVAAARRSQIDRAPLPGDRVYVLSTGRDSRRADANATIETRQYGDWTGSLQP